jgi:cell division protein ZapA (FtsZ GTPase activity inhibitor)
LDKEGSEKEEVELEEMLDWAGASGGTRQTIAELKHDVDRKLAEIDSQIEDVKTLLLTVTDPNKKEIHELLLAQMYETKERVDSEFGILSTMFILSDIQLRLLRTKPNTEDARAVARRETQRQIRTLEQRISDSARRRWFRQNFGKRGDK